MQRGNFIPTLPDLTDLMRPEQKATANFGPNYSKKKMCTITTPRITTRHRRNTGGFNQLHPLPTQDCLICLEAISITDEKNHVFKLCCGSFVCISQAWNIKS